MLECVVNVSEGRDSALVAELGALAGACLLDTHSDPHHNRSVLTLAALERPQLEEAVQALATGVVERLDLAAHTGAHPRFGVLDVVPWVPIVGRVPQTPGGNVAPPLTAAVAARDRFCAWAGPTLGLPCFSYGPERSLPEVRRHAFEALAPDTGPAHPHPTAGACAVGARHVLVAYNLVVAGLDLAAARSVAASVRGPSVRALAFAVGDEVQVSCNLLDPVSVGPADVYDGVAEAAAACMGMGMGGIGGGHAGGPPWAELVGLVPHAALVRVPPARWRELDLDESRTIEARIEERFG